MKIFFTLLTGLIFFSSGIAQSANTGVSAAATAPTTKGERSLTSQNIYYKDNLVAHFKAKTGEDLFATYPDFPHYADSGDMTKDILAYRRVVFGWMKERPDFLKKYNIDPKDLTITE